MKEECASAWMCYLIVQHCPHEKLVLIAVALENGISKQTMKIHKKKSVQLHRCAI